MDKIIRVDMQKKEISVERPSQQYERLAGRGLCSYIIANEVPAEANPIGKNNKIVFASGLFAGTAAPNSARLSIAAKSPLTRGIKEANVGGVCGYKLGRLGIKAVVLEGSSDKFFILHINRDGANLIPADELKGLKNYELCERLKDKYGDVGILCIGPCGEMLMSAATIASTDPDRRPSRHAARGGLGAVMGAKGIKAIVMDDSGTKLREPKHKDKFQSVCKEFTKKILDRKATQLLSKFGTIGGLTFINKIGALPTRGFRQGSFEGAEKIGGRAVSEINAKRGGSFGHICMPGCVVKCSNVIHDKDGRFITAGFEYESAALLGANLGIDDLDIVIMLERMCDDFGIDTMETGVTLGVAHDAGLINFGDGRRALELVNEIGQGTVLGRILGQGAEITAKVFGISRVPVVKGLGIPAHDPRREKGTGIGYSISPQGADHTGIVIFQEDEPEKLAKMAAEKQMLVAAYDSMGFCQWAEADAKIMAELVNAFYGWDWDEKDVMDFGRSIIKKELEFNRMCGLGPATDTLPEFMKEEPLSPSNQVFDIPEEIKEKVLNAF